MTASRRELLAGLAAVGAALPGAADAIVPAHLDVLKPGASAEAQALYRYLLDIYGVKTLTGQQESIWQQPGGPRYELDYILQVSGKEPAVLGLDYIDPNDRAALNDRATAWYHDKGGIATICWHWGNPLVGAGYAESKIHFDVAKAITEGTAEHQAMWRDLTEIGDWLTQLRDRKVPVLWRPFHEFTGDWFWWGQAGASGFKALWTTMHDYFTQTRGLNNLIWVLGYTKDVRADYYPGRGYADILSADDYVDHHGALEPMFSDLLKLGTGLPIALQENGPIPDPDELVRTGTSWLWFLTWHSAFIRDGKTNPAEFINRVYNSKQYVTLDELPDLRV